MDGDRIWGNLGILALLATGLAAVAAVMGKVAPKLSSGAVFLLAFAASMHLLIGVMKSLQSADFSKNWSSIPLLATFLTGLVAVAAACGNLKMGSAAGILAVAASLGILANTFQKIASLDLKNAKGSIGAFTAIFASFAGIMAASKLAGRHAARAGAGIMAMSAALLLLVPAIKGLGKLDPLDMERASKAITKLMLVFAAVTAASRLAGTNATKAGAMLLLMSGAITILSGVMVLLTHIESEGLDRALAAITKLELVMGAVVAMTHFAKDCKGTVTMIAITIGLLATALGALSLIDPSGLQSATTALSVVMGAFSLVVASSGLAKDAKAEIAVMTAAVAALAVILGLLSSMAGDSALVTATGLSELLLALSGAIAIIGKAGTVSASAYAAIGIMTAVVAGLAAILGVMSYMDVEPSIETATSLSMLLLAMSGACLILSKVGATGSAAFVGIGALATLIAAVGGLMVGIGALAEYFPSMEQFLNHGLELLEKIGYGLGSFVGNIIGGFAAGTTAGLPEIGSNLSAFMTNAKPFFENVKDIDPDAMTGVEALAGAVLMLSGADILNSLTSWLTGGASLTTFAEQLTEFGKSFKAYADEVSGINNIEVVTASAAAAKTLAEFASAIPNSGGLIANLTGENSLTAFAEELKAFGPAFAEYAGSVSGINAETVTASASAAQSLAAFASAVPNSGGWLAAIMGENSLAAFAEELRAFGPAFADYAANVTGVNSDTVAASASAARALAEFASAVPNSGGVLAKIAGDNSLSAFAEELSVFGPAFAAYASSITGVDAETVTASASAAKALAALAKELPNTGGLAGLLAGENNIDDFGTRLAAFGESFKMYYNSLSDISDISRLTDVTSAIRDLVDLANGAGSSGNKLKNFGNFLKGLADTKMEDFVNAFKDAGPDIKKAGETLGKNLETGIRNSLSNFKKVGQDAAQGLINGVKSKLSAATSAGSSLGQAVVSGTRKALDSHSPSEEERKAGADAGAGLVLGVKSTVGKVKAAGSKLGNAVVEGTNQALNGVNVDAWIGKVNKAEKEEVKAAGNTAKADKKSADAKTKSAKKVSAAKKESSKSSFEVFKEYIEEEEFYGRIDTAEKLEQYKKVLDAYKLSAEERKEVCREIYTLEKQLRDESYQHSMDWIEKEKYFNRLSLEEELAAYERVQARYKQGTDEWLKMEKEKYRVKKELEDAAYQNSMNWIEKEESYDRLGMAAKLAAYIRVQQRYAQGTEKRKQLDKEVYSLQKQMWQAEKDYYADVEKVNNEYHEKRMSLEQEYADKVSSVNRQLEQNIQNVNNRLAQDVQKVDQQLAQDIQSVNERLEQDILSVIDQLAQDIQNLNDQLEQDIKSLNEQYDSSLESRMNTLYDAYGLFDAVTEKEEVSGDILTKNLEDQIQEFESWQDTLDSLSSRGLSEELLSELQEMGPSSIAQVRALNSMTDSELEKYASLWGIKHALAREQATSELKGLREDTDAQIEQLRKDADRQLEALNTDADRQISELRQNATNEIAGLRQDAASEIEGLRQDAAAEIAGMRQDAEEELSEYRAEWEKQMSELESTTAKQLEDLKTTFEKTVGLLPEYTEAEFSEMVTSANNILRQAGWTELGQQIVAGLAAGVQNHKQDFANSLTDLANTGVDAVKTALDIHSPSRVFGKLGSFAAMGFVNALSNYGHRSYEAGLSLADNARKGLSVASDSIANVLESDQEPVIRPVLDLTDVEAEAGRLDDLFTREQHLLVQNVSRIDRRGDQLNAFGDMLRNSLVTGDSEIVDAISQLRSDVSLLSESIQQMQIVLDSGTLVGELTPGIDRELGVLANWRGRNM